MAFMTITCPRSGRPIKVASKKRAIRMMVNAQRELLKDRKREATTTPPSDFEGLSKGIPYQVFEGTRDKNGVRSYTVMSDRPSSPELNTVDFDVTREVIAQRIIRHSKAAPQRKRRTK